MKSFANEQRRNFETTLNCNTVAYTMHLTYLYKSNNVRVGPFELQTRRYAVEPSVVAMSVVAAADSRYGIVLSCTSYH